MAVIAEGRFHLHHSISVFKQLDLHDAVFDGFAVAEAELFPDGAAEGEVGATDGDLAVALVETDGDGAQPGAVVVPVEGIAAGVGELLADGGVGAVIEDGLDEGLEPGVACGENVLGNCDDDFAFGLIEEIVAGRAEAEFGGTVGDGFDLLRFGESDRVVFAGRVEDDDLEGEIGSLINERVDDSVEEGAGVSG